MAVNIKDRKEVLRRHFLAVRKNISKEAHQKRSRQILAHLTEMSQYRDAHYIHCYVSMNDRNEVNTHPLIRQMLTAGKQAVVPVTKFETDRLAHRQIDSFDNLQPNRWGVPEPHSGKEAKPEKLQLVIVPMVAGDLLCNRLGYGKGFYDRFLSQVNCPKIGLLFECCLADRIPTEHFDIKLDHIVTEDRVIDRE